MPIQPPVPLSIVLGKSFVHDSRTWPALGRLRFKDGLILHGHFSTHCALGGERHVRPSVRIVLLDHAGGTEELYRLLEHPLAQFWRRIFLSKYPIYELQTIR